MNSNDKSIREILEFYFTYKKFFLFILFLTLIFSILFSISKQNIYKSEAVLAPSMPQDKITSSLSNYSNLASITGINIPQENTNLSQEALKRMQSYEFFSKHFLPDIKLENLMAAKKWDPLTNTVSYDESIYDELEKQWVRKVKFPRKSMPSDQEAYKVYKKIFNVSVDRRTSFVSLSMEHISSTHAQKWLEIIINNVNYSMRQNDINRAEKSILFLSEYAKSTNLQSLKDSISSVLESEMRTLMLASTNEDYVYKLIQPPYAQEEKFKPERLKIILISMFIGFIIAVFIIPIFHFLKKNEYEESSSI
ncbi:hypothetical protein N9M12_00415 [Gammaproteobacteria bacterium]|nr:hypothetical protein [Gammaproteobacteria bacterium]